MLSPHLTLSTATVDGNGDQSHPYAKLPRRPLGLQLTTATIPNKIN
jgi:hypothetical protein